MRRAPRFTTTVAAAVSALVLPAALVLAAPPPLGDAGRPLAEALLELRERGLEVFFTSQVVRPEMRVESEPGDGSPREVLDALLAPHGLTWEAGPGGRLVIVEATGPAGVRGVIRIRESSRPLPGVRIVVAGHAREAVSDAEGRFELAGITPGLHTVEAHLPGFIVQRVAGIAVYPHRLSELEIELDAMPLALDEIIVTPSRVSLMSQEPVTALDLDRDDILSLPHLGDDIFRALTLLPGVAGEETSARFNVRGGRTDEVLVLLDRVELYEPYHLKDLASALSIVAPRALREVNLITGGFPAEYGDRMSGVLDMSTSRPGEPQGQIALGIPNLEAGGSGTFAGERGHGMGIVRRGSLEFALDFLGRTENPVFWDAFAKASFQARPGQTFGAHVLHSEDTLDSIMVEEDSEGSYDTSYGNSYVWIIHQAILGSRLFVDSTASVGRVDRDRRGADDEFDEGEFAVSDDRRLDVAGLKQDWNLEASERHYLKWGFDVRDMEARYDYRNLLDLDDPLEEYRSLPRRGTTELRQRLGSDNASVYLSDRLRPFASLTLELGLRWDEQSLTSDSNLSPRINLVKTLGSSSILRFAWGYFYQSQRPYELQVEDGESTLAQAERTEQRVAGFERRFVTGAPLLGDLLVRLEGYQRIIDNPRIRFENLFEQLNTFPETEPDRFRFAPQSAESRGLELFVRGQLSRHLDWWLSYAFSEVFDRIDGRDVPRRFDQTHAFNVDFNLHAGPHWQLNLAWRYHTGWPTTAILGTLEEDDEGELEVVPSLGPINAERLPDYHRLDLRASRQWRFERRGAIGFFLEIQNVYDRQNLAGFDVGDFEFDILDDGSLDVLPEPEIWGGILPSFGLTWEF